MPRSSKKPIPPGKPPSSSIDLTPTAPYGTPFHQYQSEILRANDKRRRGRPIEHSKMIHELHYKLKCIEYLYSDGVAFTVPVKRGTKILAWKQHTPKPVLQSTAERLINEYWRRGRERSYKYDLAVNTGTWRLPERDRNQVLIVIDVDNWDELVRTARPIAELLFNQQTFCINTGRGLHFYYWVPAWAAKSQSIPGMIDLLGRGRIAVVTGPDRELCFNANVAIPSLQAVQTLVDFFASHPANPHRSRWGIGSSVRPIGKAAPDYPPGYKAPLGTRNYFVNGEVYRMRHQFDDEESAVEYAIKVGQERCDPPYPDKQAAAIGRSIYRNCRRQKPKSITNGPPQGLSKGDQGIYRLAQCFPNVGDRFTREDFEKALHSNRWHGNSTERIPITQKDLKRNLEAGYIVVADKDHSKPGRPTLIYERVKAFHINMDFVLPVKPTAKNFRLSMMLHLLPEFAIEVVRMTLANYLGVKKERISHYAKILTDPSLWHGILLLRRKRKPRTRVLELPPDADPTVAPPKQYEYLPSIYHRQPFYNRLMQKGAMAKSTATHSGLSDIIPPLSPLIEKPLLPMQEAVFDPKTGKKRWIGDVVEEALRVRRDRQALKTTEFQLPSGLAQSSHLKEAFQILLAEMSERRIHEVGYDDLGDLSSQQLSTLISPQTELKILGLQAQAPHCKNCDVIFSPTKDEPLCPTCEEHRKKVVADRMASLTEPDPVIPHEDYCHHCHQFFETDEYPLLGFCKKCRDKVRLKHEPIKIVFCSNACCMRPSYLVHYNNWKAIDRCPACKCPQFMETLYAPEVTLKGYPHNRYLPYHHDKTIFDMMNFLYRPDQPSYMQDLERILGAPPTEELIEAWRAYKEDDGYKNLICPSCEEPFRKSVEDIVFQGERTVCPTCERLSAQAGSDIPPNIQRLIESEEQAEIQRLEALFERLFECKPRYKQDIANLVLEYTIDWVDCAIRVAGQQHDKNNPQRKIIHAPIPFIRATLHHWQLQGYINGDNRRWALTQLTQERRAARTWKPSDLPKLALKEKTPFHLFATLTKRLTVFTAPFIALAIKLYGDRATRYAILAMVRAETPHWNYAKKVLERLKEQDLLQTCSFGEFEFEQLPLL